MATLHLAGEAIARSEQHLAAALEPVAALVHIHDRQDHERQAPNVSPNHRDRRPNARGAFCARRCRAAGRRTAGYPAGLARFQQWEGYVESLPLGRAELGLLIDISGQAVAMGLPTATPGLRRGGLPIV